MSLFSPREMPPGAGQESRTSGLGNNTLHDYPLNYVPYAFASKRALAELAREPRFYTNKATGSP